MARILIVEDEQDIRQMMCEYLENSGFTCVQAHDGAQALAVLEQMHIDLMITDVMMPNMDGFALTNLLRQSAETMPILIITAKDSLDDKEQGFLSGTDDYMVKPIILREMLLRVRALLKRANVQSAHIVQLSTLHLDANCFSAHVAGEQVELTKKEFLLLFRLLSNPGEIFTRAKLMDEIWGYDTESDDSTIKVHISKLRNKFANCADFTLVAIKGIGYKAVLQ